MTNGETLRSMLVEYGFSADPASQAKAEAAVKQTEERITAASLEGSKRRAEAASAEADHRVETADETGKALVDAEERRAAKVDKVRKDEAAKARLNEETRAKRTEGIQTEQFKKMEAGILRIASVGQAASAGLSGLLSALPFGGFALGVARTASGLSDLAVQSQRVGASAAHIQRFLFAMRQQGVDEGQANSDLEGFSKVIRGNPTGYRQALARMGVKTTDDNGKDLDDEQLLENFGPVLSRMPYNIAQIQAGHFGVTGPDTLNALRDPTASQRGYQDYDQKLKDFGLDPNKATEDARKVDQAYSNLEADLRIINTKLQAEFFLPVMVAFDNLAKKMEQNPQAVENIGRGLEAATVALSARLLPKLANLGVRLSGLAPVLGGGLGTLLGIVTNPVVALGASAESTPGAGVPADAAERAKVEAENKRLTDEANKKLGYTGNFWADTKTYFSRMFGFGSADDRKVKDDISTIAESTKKLADAADGGGAGGGGGNRFGFGGSGGGFGRAARGGGGMGGGGPSAITKQEQKNNAAAIADELRKAGMPDEGVAAVLGSMQTESAFRPRAHNDVSGGHNGLWQWDSTRWPKVAAWIKSQGGDPWDARWQARAYVAEGRAKPGDALFDTGETSAGFRDVMGSKGNLKLAVTGVRRSERFGIGEEGGREANAGKWLGNLPAAPTAQAPVPAGTSSAAISDAEVFAARQRIAAGGTNPHDLEIVRKYLQQQNTAKQHISALIDKHVRNGTLAGLTSSRGQHFALGDSPALRASISHNRTNSFTRNGDTFNVSATNLRDGMDQAARISARRGDEDRIRYGQSAQS